MRPSAVQRAREYKKDLTGLSGPLADAQTFESGLSTGEKLQAFNSPSRRTLLAVSTALPRNAKSCAIGGSDASASTSSPHWEILLQSRRTAVVA